VEAADKQTSDLFLKATRNASYLSWRAQSQIISLMGDAVAIGNPERHMRKASYRGSKQQ